MSTNQRDEMTYGYMNVQRHKDHYKKTGEFLRVIIDGMDVTDRCMECNDSAGTAVLLCNDAQHRDWRKNDAATHVTPDAGEQGPHTLSVHGHVVMSPGSKGRTYASQSA